MAVEQTLTELGILYSNVSLGHATIPDATTPKQLASLKSALETKGFGWLDDKDSQDVEAIKAIVIDLVHNRDNDYKGTLSSVISENLNRDYGMLSHLFSQTTGTTLEQYYILQKIERVKELLSYGEENLNEIADRLQYSSPSHLSRQFKSVTGMTPTDFRKTYNHRNFIDGI